MTPKLEQHSYLAYLKQKESSWPVRGMQSQRQKRQTTKLGQQVGSNYQAGQKRLRNGAMLAGTLQAVRLATFWAESTCWTALATAARKAGDVGETTDVEDRAVEAMLDSDGAHTDFGGISSDSCTRDKVSYAADGLLQVFLVFIIFLVSGSTKTVRESTKVR